MNSEAFSYLLCDVTPNLKISQIVYCTFCCFFQPHRCLSLGDSDLLGLLQHLEGLEHFAGEVVYIHHQGTAIGRQVTWLCHKVSRITREYDDEILMLKLEICIIWIDNVYPFDNINWSSFSFKFWLSDLMLAGSKSQKCLDGSGPPAGNGSNLSQLTAQSAWRLRNKKITWNESPRRFGIVLYCTRHGNYTYIACIIS